MIHQAQKVSLVSTSDGIAAEMRWSLKEMASDLPLSEIIFTPESDPHEKKGRVVCGILFGLVAGFLAGL